MQATRTVTTLVAAASLVGAIGLAYAQQAGGGTSQTPQQAQMGAMDGTPNNNSNMNNATTQNPGATPTQTPMQTQANPNMGTAPDLPPQADRN